MKMLEMQRTPQAKRAYGRRIWAFGAVLLLVIALLAGGCSSKTPAEPNGGKEPSDGPSDGYTAIVSLSGAENRTEKFTLTKPQNRVRCQIEGTEQELRYQIIDAQDNLIVVFGGQPDTEEVNDYNLQPGDYTLKVEAQAEYRLSVEEK
ncbi:MAG: hypothetical protein ACOX3R_07375 [Desulfitobacteriia bacterium]|jgi:hypothetical protein